MAERLDAYPLNGFRICVEQLDADVSGIVYSPLSEEPIPFRGIGDLLLRMDSLFDEAGYPQSFQEKRSFDAPAKGRNRYRGLPERRHAAKRILSMRGTLGTCDIRIDSRRNASWQGTTTDLATGVSRAFRGDMELLRLLADRRDEAEACSCK